MRSISPIRVAAFCLSILAIGFCGDSSLAANDQSDEVGQKIYVAQCSGCHGDRGQGTDEFYQDTLSGDLSVEQLAEVISDTMPEEDPEMCVAEDADAVAKYIYSAFYSAEAQRKLNRPRVELAHLTVRQHRQSIAGLIETFTGGNYIPKERGLTANYFAASHWKKDRMLAEESVRTIDFKDGVPHFRSDRKYEKFEEQDKKKKKKQNEIGTGFSAYWNGSVIAPETGSYEFIVHSKNGFKLFVNDPKNALIDRWVRGNDDLTHRANVFLLGGRAYTLKLQMFTFKESTAAIELQWKPPGGEVTLIPNRNLAPQPRSEVAAMSTSLPPDDGSRGYLRGVSVSQGWDEATTNVALESADWISQRIWELAKTRENKEDRVEKVQNFCHRFVARAFGSPLSNEQKEFFVGQHFSDDLSIKDSVRRVVLMTLKSPRFLYPAFQPRNAEFEKARRLSLFFLDSVPDEDLFKAASKQKLNDQQLVEHAWRLLYTPNAKQKLKDFFHHWLKYEEAIHASKDEELYPGFDRNLTTDLQVSLDLFLDEIVWSEEPDFREIFLSNRIYVNQRIADYYDLPIETQDAESFVVSESESIPRSGVLTHPLLMSGFAYRRDTSPIHRGVFIARNLLGRSLKQPAEAIPPLKEDFDPTMTTRQRVEHQTKAVACQACHSVINPLGFSLENYDAVGRFRETERKKRVNVESVYETPDGKSIKLSGARDLGKHLAHDVTAQKSFVRRLFEHFTNQSIYAYGDDVLDELHQAFAASGFNVQVLLVEMAITVAGHDLPETPVALENQN